MTSINKHNAVLSLPREVSSQNLRVSEETKHKLPVTTQCVVQTNRSTLYANQSCNHNEIVLITFVFDMFRLAWHCQEKFYETQRGGTKNNQR
jgi:hypothetical protein